jgi:hypothetical protein
MSVDESSLERGKRVAEQLRALHRDGIVVTAAEQGLITELACQMPECLCPEELGGKHRFDPLPGPLSDWVPTPDHRVLKSEGGQLTLYNVRLAHRLCNSVDYAETVGRSTEKERARVESARLAALGRTDSLDSEFVGLGERFERAFVYASHVHGGQTRKSTTIPYVSHLLGVASLVLEDGGGEDEAVAALLHDACEDQGGLDRLRDIRFRFGDRVARIVEACTDTFESPKPPWRPRKEAYIAKLIGEEPDAVRVSLADKVHNAHAIVRDLRTGDDVWSRFNAGRDDQIWYYGELLRVFRDRVTSPLAVELGDLFKTLTDDTTM